jgi:hypothetical protein
MAGSKPELPIETEGARGSLDSLCVFQLPGLGGEVNGGAVTELKRDGERERGEDTLAKPGSRSGNTKRNLIGKFL